MKNKSNQAINSLDIEELQSVLTGCESEDSGEIESALYDKFGIDSENFEFLIRSLFEMLTFNVSQLTNTAFVGFGKDGVWTIKKDVTNEFIGAVIQFLLDGEEYNKDGRGYTRIITDDDKPEYQLLITKPENTIQVIKPEDTAHIPTAKDAYKYLNQTADITRSLSCIDFSDKLIIDIANHIWIQNQNRTNK